MATTRWLKWTDRLQAVVRNAQRLEAARGNSCLTTETIFVALLGSQGVAVAALRDIGVAPSRLKSEFLLSRGMSDQSRASGLAARLAQFVARILQATRGHGQTDKMLPLSEPARVVFTAGEQEASSLRHNYLGTEHILLGMLATKNDASDVLASDGVQYESVREAVKRALRH